jgi:hypothetical protein
MCSQQPRKKALVGAEEVGGRITARVDRRGTRQRRHGLRRPVPPSTYFSRRRGQRIPGLSPEQRACHAPASARKCIHRIPISATQFLHCAGAVRFIANTRGQHHAPMRSPELTSTYFGRLIIVGRGHEDRCVESFGSARAASQKARFGSDSHLLRVALH